MVSVHEAQAVSGHPQISPILHCEARCTNESDEITGSQHEDVVHHGLRRLAVSEGVMPGQLEEIDDLNDGIPMVRELGPNPRQLPKASRFPTDSHELSVAAGRTSMVGRTPRSGRPHLIEGGARSERG